MDINLFQMPTLTPTRERIKEKAKARSEAKQSKPSSKPKKLKSSSKSNDDSFNFERFIGTLIMIVIFVALVSFGTYNFLHWVAYGFDKNYSEIKQCQNNGGKWDHKLAKCSK